MWLLLFLSFVTGRADHWKHARYSLHPWCGPRSVCMYDSCVCGSKRPLSILAARCTDSLSCKPLSAGCSSGLRWMPFHTKAFSDMIYLTNINLHLPIHRTGFYPCRGVCFLTCCRWRPVKCLCRWAAALPQAHRSRACSDLYWHQEEAQVWSDSRQYVLADHREWCGFCFTV